MATTYSQHNLTLPSLPRGSHLITEHVVSSLPEMKSIRCGLLHLFLQHTSCGLTMNENFDSDVRADMSDSLDRIVVEDKGTSRRKATSISVGYDLRRGILQPLRNNPAEGRWDAQGRVGRGSETAG